MDPNLHRFFDYVPPARKVLAIPPLALSSVMSKDQTAVYASADTLFRGAIFGRDSLEVAEDLLEIRPKLVRRILTTIGGLQGTNTNPVNEEEPGKIIHEYRSAVVDGRPIRGTQRKILHELSAKWGGTDNELAYYGSIDATPHFLRTLGSYCLLYGDSILDDQVQRRDNSILTMREIAEHAAQWVSQKLTDSQSGLLEYKRTNPHGIENQVWKDSAEFYVHEDAQMANHDRPIASIEVQGLGYDALLAASQFFPEKATHYQLQAEKLRDTTIDLLWQPNRNYFALGTDYSSEGELRVIHTKSANAAALLDTAFFDNLSSDSKEQLIAGVATTILSPDFLTDAGIRSRALSAGHLVDQWDYHGSYVSWPKETYDVAKGLRRQGLPRLARQLENRLLNIVLKTQEYPEFVYVDEWGRVLGGAPSTRQHGEIITVKGSNKPERLQAWTVSAITAILARRVSEKGRKKVAAERPSLESQLYDSIPHIDRYLNQRTLRTKYPSYKYRLSGQPRA